MDTWVDVDSPQDRQLSLSNRKNLHNLEDDPITNRQRFISRHLGAFDHASHERFIHNLARDE